MIRRVSLLARIAINPVNNARIPIWVADYVLMGYGFGAIMAVPAHDQRDFEFARKFKSGHHPSHCPARRRVGLLDEMEVAYIGPGVMVNSGEINGTAVTDRQRSQKSLHRCCYRLAGRTHKAGEESVNYRLRGLVDQPSAVLGCAHSCDLLPRPCGPVLVPDEDLPVMLPDEVEFMPTGESPAEIGRRIPAHYLP